MKWLDQLERRFHFVTIPQFPLFIATANGLIYLMSQFEPGFVLRLTLNPQAVLAGEWWRVITFLFVPPLMSPIWFVFWLLFLYQCSQALENAWGEFRFFFFYFVGAAATSAAAILILNQTIGNGFLYSTLFLAFATLYPETELLLFFILPIKVKYLAWFTWLMVGISFVLGTASTRVAIVAALSNYFLFFGADLWKGLKLRWEIYQNRRRFRP